MSLIIEQLWTQLDRNGQKWTIMDKIGLLWTKLDYYGHNWTLFTKFGSIDKNSHKMDKSEQKLN